MGNDTGNRKIDEGNRYGLVFHSNSGHVTAVTVNGVETVLPEPVLVRSGEKIHVVFNDGGIPSVTPYVALGYTVPVRLAQLRRRIRIYFATLWRAIKGER